MLPLRGATMVHKRKVFLCTRPTLARLLMESGEVGNKVINPYRPEYWAWEFKITPTVLSVATDYYKSIEQPLPCALRGAADDKQP